MAAGQVPSAPCSITPIRPSRDANMFTPAQEVDLGEVLVEIVRDNAKELDDPDLTTYLQQIGDRLASHLPPLGLKYRFLSFQPPDRQCLFDCRRPRLRHPKAHWLCALRR